MQREMDQKYRNVVIFIEIGKFFEVYTYETEEAEVGRAKDVSRICNIVLTRKNKGLPISMANPHMCGFPSHSLSRYVSHLIQHQFTVVVYEQAGDTGNGMERRIKGIYSPAVVMEEDSEEDSETMMMTMGEDRGILSLWCETVEGGEEVIVVFVHVNTTTGAVSCEEVCSDAREALSYVRRVLDMFAPREVVRNPCILLDEVLSSENRMIHDMPEAWLQYADTEYQEKVLAEIFPSSSSTMLSTIEILGLERHPDIVPVLVHLLDFLRAHHPLAVYRLQPPSFEYQSEKVFYNARALSELDVFPGIFNLLDGTVTRGGGRLLRRLFFSPLHDQDMLKRRYDEIEAALPLIDTLDLRKRIQHHMIDADHHLRRLQVGSIGVQAAYRLLRFLMDVRGIVEDLPDALRMETRGEESAWEAMEREALDRWDLHFMQTWRSWETSGVWKTVPPELLEKENELLVEDAAIREWIRNKFGEDMIGRLVMAEDGAHLQMTKKMAKELQVKDTSLHLKTMSSGVRAHHPTLDRYSLRRRAIVQFLVQTRRAIFHRETQELSRTHERIMMVLLRFIARLDVVLSHARNTHRFRLCRPRFHIDRSTNESLHMTELRHLIVEKARPDTKYISNDVELTEEKGRGILLFGQNSAGKSTLMKSVAVAVLMAQCGMFVPCASMTWTPFHSLFTKIGSSDDIWKGKSTFITEMMELRHILERSDQHSLIVCDELTSGTETFSATGIVASTIQRLAEQKSFFIMTTHLHTLKRFEELVEDPRVRIMHIGMSLENKKLVFDRKLRDGFGKSIYGLEIAEFLGFPTDFIKKAYDFRARLEDKDEHPSCIVPNKRSRYNKKKIVDRCEICRSTKDLHTHHIAHQAAADHEGYIGTQHKNVLHNLQILCRSCHEKEHDVK
jgi:DNA mismatch repair protein MutS